MKALRLSILFLFVVSCGVDQQSKISIPKGTNSKSSGFSTTITSSDSHPDKKFPSSWSVTRKILKGGKQEGVELLTIDNGKLEISLIPTRGMGILDVKMGEIRLGWIRL